MLTSILSRLAAVPRYVYAFVRDGPSGLTSHAIGPTQDPANLQLSWETDYAVRVQLDQYGNVRIFGFPVQGTELPGTVLARPLYRGRKHIFLHLRTQTPACIEYIMGTGWQQRLRKDYKVHYSDAWQPQDVVLRPGWQTVSDGTTEEDYLNEERAHCLRMRRCGAIATRSQLNVVLYETSGPDDHITPHLLGWPDDGGMWILRAPPDVDPWFAEDSIKQLWARYDQADSDIVGKTSMRDVCLILELAGAQYYKDPADCEEVVKMALA